MRHLHASRIKVALFFVQTTVFVYLFIELSINRDAFCDINCARNQEAKEGLCPSTHVTDAEPT
ncbi:hypothetical protein BZJ18_10405 [Salinivibrio sp. IB872]|jgi:hypothetical protein|nr:hypothetical protein BZJ18_10405 [Salinivibrio sp. IB872]